MNVHLAYVRGALLALIGVALVLWSTLPLGTRALAQIGAADAAILYVPEPTTGMALIGQQLYWHTSCGGEFYPARSYVRSVPTTSGTTHTLYNPATCQNDRVASANIAVDDMYVYWLTANGRVVRLARSATAGTAPTELSQMESSSVAGYPSCCWVAVDGTYVYWNDGVKIFRATKTGGARQQIGTATSFVRELRAGGDGAVFYIDGARLRVLIPFSSAYIEVPVADSAVTYALGSTRVYWAVNGSTNYQIQSKRRNDLADLRTHHTSASGSNTRVDNLAVDLNNLYWHEIRNITGGPIMRQAVGGGAPTPISDYRTMGTPMLSDGQYLFWTDYNTGIFRLPVSASPTPPAGDVFITGVEVTQAIQTLDNQIPLLAYKKTVVRVYVQSREDSAGPWHNVRAYLTVSGGSTHAPTMRSSITVSPVGSNRNSLEDSFLFELNASETAPGSRTMQVQLIMPSGRPEFDTTNNTRSVTVQFNPRINASVYGMVWGQRATATDPGFAPAAWSDFELHRAFTENVFPVSQLDIVPIPGVGRSAPPESPFESEAAAADWAFRMLARLPAGSKINRLDNVDSCACGYATGSFSTEQNNRTAATAPGSTMAQEIAHTFGLWWHTFDPTPFPRRDESIGPETGMKTTMLATPPLAAGLQPVPPSSGGQPTPDYMSYNVSRANWTSPFTYCTLMRVLSGGSQYCPSSVEGGGAVAGAADVSTHQLVQAQAEQRFLFVSGQIDLDGTARFAPFEIIQRSQDITQVPTGTKYTLVLEDAGGNVLSQHPFTPHHSHHPNQPERPDVFNLVVPYPAGTARVVLRSGKTSLAVREVSKSTPSVAWSGLANGATLSGMQTLKWAASDADGDQLIFAVEYSPDNGQNWLPVAAALTQLSAKVNFDQVPGTDQGLLRVVASDGLNMGSATIAIRVPRKVPQITVVQPNHSMSVPLDQETLFESNAFDWEDGPITNPAAYSWTSSRDGVVGTGPWLSRSLSQGTHTLTVSVRDSSGNSASASIVVYVGRGNSYLPLISKP